MAIRPNLVDWQWSGYDAFHQTKLNLVLHIIGVPVFLSGLAEVFVSLLTLHPWGVLSGLFSMAVGFALQAVGHKREVNASIPFDGKDDAFSRIFVEQCVTFPRFILSGGFKRAWLAAK